MSCALGMKERTKKDRKDMARQVENFEPEKLIQDHLALVTTVWLSDLAGNWARDVIQQILDDELGAICLLADEKMNESLFDGERHSTAIWKDDLFISISTFPCSVEEVKRTHYPKGYLTYLDRMVGIARQENPRCHWLHFQFFWNGTNFLVQFTLFPNKDVLDFTPMYHLPTDLLSDEDAQNVARNEMQKAPCIKEKPEDASMKSKTIHQTSRDTADWSTTIHCHDCGAGNPVNATECIRCKKKLFLPEQHVPMKPHVSQKDLEERKARISTIDRFRLRTNAVISPDLTQASSKKKWWQKLLIACFIICSVSLAILLLLAGSIFIVTNIYKIAVFILGMLLFSGVALIINYLIETQDLREAKRDERNAEQAKEDMRKKQTHLDMEVERITNVIRKKVEKNKPLENILPNIRSKDYEALAKAISSTDLIKDKGCLFKNVNPDFISKVLTYLSEADEINILQQIEPEKRKDILFRCSLSKRNRLESVLKESEVSSQESNDSDIDVILSASKPKPLYICDICRNTFDRDHLDEHFAEIARQVAAIKGVTWSEKLVTFDGNGKAWCPHCFKDPNSMRSGRRTVHAGKKKSYLYPPNLEISYQCKCGRHKTFHCKSVNIYTGLEVMCADCAAILWVPPTIFNHSKPSQPGEASLRPNYQDQMTFVKYRKSELDQRLKDGVITEQEHRDELKRRGL